MRRSYTGAWRTAMSADEVALYRVCMRRRVVLPRQRTEIDMGKYFIAWLLGVPAVVLVGIYAFTHLV